MDLCPNCFTPKLSGGKCTVCGYQAIVYNEGNVMLPPGTRLNDRYILGRVLGAGGFGITYLAKDLRENRLCAVKEYFPVNIAVRSYDRKIYAGGTKNEGIFQHSMEVFINEANILSRFIGNPNIVQVHDCFKENNTAYFSMEYLDGVNLKILAKSMNDKMPYSMAFEILVKMARTLGSVHKEGLLHRDVSPENIFITKSAEIKLIDFGATRQFMGEKSKSLSVILKPGFAPPEQYSSKGNQGPWTDIYALSSTFYFVLTGEPVPDAMERLSGKQVKPLGMLLPEAPPHVSNAIQHAIELNHANRTPSIQEFLFELGVEFVKAGPTPKQAAPVKPPAPPTQKPATPIRKPEPASNVPSPVDVANVPYIQILTGSFAGNKWILPYNIDMVIGRASSTSNIVLEDLNISRVHCMIRYDDRRGRFFVQDLSTNGTYGQNGSRMEKNRVYGLEPGAQFYLYSKDYMFRVGLEK